ncbi:MAG: hypothetical protein DWP98_11130, partial [Bacteroidetes bacterium]
DGGSIVLNDSSATNDIQTLSLNTSNDELTISATGGNTIDLTPILNKLTPIFNDSAATLIRTSPGNYADDFVFGSPQLADDGNINHDNRFFFDKSKGALRAGYAQGSEWNDANIGIASTAFGENTKASGFSSFAGGRSTTASGSYSTAFGFGSIASGTYGFAASRGYASGDYGAAFGFLSFAQGHSSFVAGNGNRANGDNSAVFGIDNFSSGFGSFVAGRNNNASGDGSVAFGDSTNADSYGEFVAGSYNTVVSPNSTTSFNALDRLFVLGNGTANGSESDALIVYKSGDAILNGQLTLSTGPGGDSLTFPNTDGTANQILKTDGSGQLSFVDISSLTSSDTLDIIADADRNTSIDINTGDDIIFKTNGTDRLVIDQNGHFDLTTEVNSAGLLDTTYEVAQFNAALSGDFKDRTGGHLSFHGSDGGSNFEFGRLSWMTNDGESEGMLGFETGILGDLNLAMIIDENQQVGIGTNNPSEKLHVVGNIKMVDGNQASGKVLSSDANGVASWEDLGNLIAADTLSVLKDASNNERIDLTNGDSILFKTDGITRMKLMGNSYSGRIAMGIGTPNGRLHVHTSSDNYTGYFTNTASTSIAYGVNSVVSGQSGYNAGLSATVSGATNENVGLNLTVNSVSSGGFSPNAVGVRASVTQTGTPPGIAYGGKFDASSEDGQSFGVRATATGLNGTSEAYGIYSKAKGGISQNWSAYLDTGNVFIRDQLVLDSNFVMAKDAAEGKVLTSDANGVARWDVIAPATCPAGMLAAGPSMCVDSTERTASTWFAAATTCTTAGYKLPTWAEWYSGTTIPGTADKTTDNWEWVDGGTSNTVRKVGNGSAEATANDDPTNTEAFRCVYYLK